MKWKCKRWWRWGNGGGNDDVEWNRSENSDVERNESGNDDVERIEVEVMK